MKKSNLNKVKEMFLNEVFILYLIVVNVVIIFIQEFNIKSSVLNTFEVLFTFLFVIEMIIKIREYGFKRYIHDKWNRLDFVLVILSIPSLTTLFINGALAGTNIFLTLRALRLFKLFRMIKFMPDIKQLIRGVKRAIKASYVILIGYFMLIFIVSIVSCSFFKNIAPEHFSNPAQSFYSIFRLFSVEGWYEIPELIATRTNPLIGGISVAFFMLLLLIGGILGLSLVNSIFVDAMVSDNNDELIEEVKRINSKLDNLNEHIEKLTKNAKP